MRMNNNTAATTIQLLYVVFALASQKTEEIFFALIASAWVVFFHSGPRLKNKVGVETGMKKIISLTVYSAVWQ
jgi:hypothetical protein